MLPEFYNFSLDDIAMVKDIPAGSIEVQKVRVFIDFWNFQLSLNRLSPDFHVDWSVFPE